HRFNQKSRFSSWLYRIAYNEFLQHCRSSQSQKNYAEFVELDDRELEYAGGHQIEQPEPGDLQKQLAQLLAQVEPERRSVLHLLLYRQCTQQEIADTMGIPLGTVKTHISRGRLALTKQLAHWRDQ
ncbi:MAG: RNA polymerase sigma factor, partial [Gammaproteobacteria bacterium]|nr:RNA polymerase sigma factor [Gammaproteobacteria bacterium]